MTTTAPELITTLTTGWADAMQRWADQSQSMWDQWGGLAAWAPPAEPRHRHHHDEECREHQHGAEHGHEHDRHEHDRHEHDRHEHDRHEHDRHECSCGCDGCHCCVPEADVVIHARVGEQRVVPFRLHNRWRREREVTLEVGPWHLCSGDGLVVEAALDRQELTLRPCQDRVVRLVIGVAAVAEKATEKAAPEAKEGKAASGPRMASGHDLEACASAYADVRFEGCARPQRVAVVVSPDHCQAVDVGCDVGC